MWKASGWWVQKVLLRRVLFWHSGFREKSSQLPILPVEHDHIPGDFNLMVANDLLRGSPDHYPIFWPDVSWLKFICVTPWKG